MSASEEAGRARPAASGASDDAVARTAPLSFAQQGLWLAERLHPGEPTYNEPVALRLTGALDVLALRRALNDVVRRHEALRTRFGLANGVPVQIVMAALELALDVEDLGALPHGERLEEARRRARGEHEVPFDLARGPLVRARLLRLSADEHWLLLTMHHIVTDGWSISVIGRELAALYLSTRVRAPSPLPGLGIQYADHALRQRGQQDGEDLRSAIDRRAGQLAGVPPLELPTDRPRPPVAGHEGGDVRFDIDAALAGRLRDLARRERVTPFMLLLAAFEVLLARYSGQQDFGVGVPSAGRVRPDLEPLVGFFVNMLVIRADLSGQPGFIEFLRRVRSAALDAYELQEVPFEALVARLAPSRDAARHPLFQVSFALHPEERLAWRLPGLVVEPLDESGSNSAKFDLALTLTEADGGLRGRLVYAAALFDAATAGRMARHFRTLLASIADDPRLPVGKLALVEPGERARLAEAAGHPRTAYPEATRIERLFEAHASARPDAVAVAAPDAAIRYGELDARANRLAHLLRADPANGSRRVGVFLERGADFVVALVAILKAGMSYLPIDPEAPAERIRSMLADASVGRVITNERLAARLPSGAAAPLCLEREAASLASAPSTRPEPPRDAEEAACVIYTSGSTGRPKGVLIPHRAIARLVVGTNYVRLGADDVVANLANPAFDATTFEIWGALANGASVRPIAREIALAPRALAVALREGKVTTAFLTTALFNAVAREEPSAFRGVKQVFFGGEAVEPRWVRQVLEAGAPARLVHVYGPTEATTFATWHEVDAADARGATIPIGRPIANTEVLILDSEGEPVPVGVPGEIHLGGPGLALGYLGAEELTAERFVPHPFPRESAAKLYRTGDRARLRADGAIEFLGRADRQVKIRGHRIELGEIETAIGALPYVRGAVVQLRGATSDTRRIVAWIVPSNASGPPPSGLRRDLARVLPEYMLPAATVWIPALPLNANGKVDVRALPEPGASARPAEGVPVPPRDMFEGVLVRVWEQVLGIRGIGIHDHFFEIGGHSLLAAQLIDTIERVTGLSAPLTALFIDDTIDGLARALREGSPDAGAPVVEVNPEGTRTPFVFLHGDFQAGGFYSRAIAGALGDDRPTLIVHPHGLAGDEVPETIEAMAADRLRSVRSLRPRGPYVLGGHCNGALVAFEMARQLLESGASVSVVVLIESRAPGVPDASTGAAGEYVKLDALGRPAPLRAVSRATDAELRYARAIDRYRGGRCEAHLVVVQAQVGRDPAPDAGWSRFAPSVEGHVVPGDHVTLITQHLDALARTLREALAKAETRGAPAPERVGHRDLDYHSARPAGR